MGYFDGWFDEAVSGGGGSGDTTPPTITKVSPVSFNPDYSVAASTPVVVDITDSAPGLGLIVVTMGDSVVYYGSPLGGFGAAFTGSTIVPIAGGYRLSFYPSAGWPSGPLALVAAAMDGDGNLTSLPIALTVPTGFISGASPQEFRDSVWRWRRRLHRQKCSVISIAIDDNYTIGPGFVLTALSLELGKRKGLDRVPWRGGSTTTPSGTNDIGNGR